MKMHIETPHMPDMPDFNLPHKHYENKHGQIDNLPPITMASICTALVMYPVDIVRALKMAQTAKGGPHMQIHELIKKFHNQHGTKGFLTNGIGAEMMRATFSRVIKFWMQPICHEKIFRKHEWEGTPLTKSISGAVGTIPEILAISAFENAKLAKQLDSKGRFKGGMTCMIKHLYQQKGIGGLYIGYFGMQIRQMLWTGGFFLTLDVFKYYLDPMVGHGPLANTISGFCAGVFGTTLNCWCDVVRTGVQKREIAATFKPDFKREPLSVGYMTHGVTDFFAVAKTIVEQKGISGLYSGFAVKSLYLGGSGALLATLIPMFKEWCQVE